jgi:signal transduction histidine kinase
MTHLPFNPGQDNLSEEPSHSQHLSSLPCKPEGHFGEFLVSQSGDLQLDVGDFGLDDEAPSHLLLENHALKQQIAAQKQLMQLLTHQLATPLTALSGSVHLLNEPSLEQEQRQEFLMLVKQQVKRLQDLLQDLMALRDIENGTLETNLVQLCLPVLIEEVLLGLQPQPVIYQFSSTLPLVWGDRWQVAQVLANLFSNAIKYSPADIPLEIGAREIEPGWVEVWVKDQGLGIPEADKPHLFERFYRVHHCDRQHIKGTGLGLSLCKLLVENQGGQIGFESTHGAGSRFYFTLSTIEPGMTILT